ncbi:MAG: DegV family protein [Ilumatobacteraceae bacterium]
MTVRIVTDSACDLPDQVANELGIQIVPLSIRFGGDEFVDRQDLTPAEFWQRCNASAVLPETAAPAPGAFEATYRRLAAEGATGVVMVALASGLSATMQSAQLAATSVADTIPVRVVDSRTATLGQGMIAVEAARAAAGGASLDEVVSLAEALADRTRVWGALDTLENLKKGGRIGNAKALLASVLSIKPIIEIHDGKVEEGGKQRTRSKALAFLVDKVRNAGPIENLAVLHAQCSDVDKVVASLREFHTGEIVVGEIGPVVGSHAGMGTIGVAFQVAG